MLWSSVGQHLTDCLLPRADSLRVLVGFIGRVDLVRRPQGSKNGAGNACTAANRVPAGIAQVHRVVERVRVPVGAHAPFRRVERVGADEAPDQRIVVARVQVAQAQRRVVALAQELAAVRQRRERAAVGHVARRLHHRTRRVRHQSHRCQMVAVLVKRDRRRGPTYARPHARLHLQPHVRVRVVRQRRRVAVGGRAGRSRGRRCGRRSAPPCRALAWMRATTAKRSSAAPQDPRRSPLSARPRASARWPARRGFPEPFGLLPFARAWERA